LRGLGGLGGERGWWGRGPRGFRGATAARREGRARGRGDRTRFNGVNGDNGLPVQKEARAWRPGREPREGES
jgi:hypothetical protein